MTGGVFALVPVKDPAQGKSRLADLLDAPERLALNRRLAQRTFDCCAAAFGPECTVVVTAAEAIAAEASARGLIAVREGSGGVLNAALALAAGYAIGQGAEALVVVPVDLVLVTPAAVQGVIADLMGAPGCVLVPDRHGTGTNVLAVRPARADLFRFGERSLDEHRRAAAKAGLEVRVHADPVLALDLDTPEDYRLWRGVASARPARTVEYRHKLQLCSYTSPDLLDGYSGPARMNFGFSVPTRGPLATREGALALAKRGEELGFAYLALSDHIVIPRNIASPYPYNVARKMVGAADGDCLEQLALLAFLAAATRKIRLLTSVMVAPHRPPVFTAKALATIDVLSQGRVVVGVGAGWMEEEFQAVGAPPFSERGKVTDEYLRAFKTLWTEDDPRFEGRYARFADISFLPKPVQKPHPPLWIGGESPAALRRVVALGDAWYPIGSNPQYPLDTVERYAQAVTGLRDEAKRAQRDPDSIALAYWAAWYKEGQTLELDDGQRRAFTGGDADVARDIAAFRALGVNDLLFNFARPTLAESLAAMERFVAQVVPLVPKS